MAAIISRGLRQKTETGPALLGRDLTDAREELFVRMACDGIALGVAFTRAGFNLHRKDAPSLLFALPRIQERAAAILEARRTTGVVTLPEVTAMLQRVFSGAVNADEFSAAHNAAFSLARLYGHVTDKATLEVLRRPSRDPDAPAEQALGAWVAGLGGSPLEGSFLRHPEGSEPQIARVSDAPAPPLGLNEPPNPNGFNALAGPEPSRLEGPEPQGSGLSNEINDLGLITSDWIACDGGVPGRPENGAPTGPVTGTPVAGARTTLLGPRAPKKGAPFQRGKVPVKKRVLSPRIPSAKDLFG